MGPSDPSIPSALRMPIWMENVSVGTRHKRRVDRQRAWIQNVLVGANVMSKLFGVSVARPGGGLRDIP